MGYRSDVGLCLTAQAQELLAAELAELIKADRAKSKTVIDLLNGAKIREDQESGAVSYYWENLKWYPDYDDVSFFESLMLCLERNSLDARYYFIRIGESDDDIEIRGGFFDNPFGMYIVRGINFDDEAVCDAQGKND
jgi:hypothetical protein